MEVSETLSCLKSNGWKGFAGGGSIRQASLAAEKLGALAFWANACV